MNRPAALALAVLAACGAAALASSHREAPGITAMPKVDGTDLYMFRSYEAGRQDFVTIIANYQPFQDPFGGPNYYMLHPNGLYEIHIDNNGDAVEDITLQFQVDQATRSQALPVGDRMTNIPLIVSGPITEKNSPNQNVVETYTVQVVRGDRRTGARANVGTFEKPLDNIGEKTFPSGYANYAQQHIYSLALPGCATAGRMFVGQRKEPFYIAVGKIFDLLNLNPLGPVDANNNVLETKSISTIAVELPISCVTRPGEPVIGAYTTASLRQARLVDPNPSSGLFQSTKQGGPWAQVSRLGMPLVNEVVIGLPDKDKFNASDPENDAQFLNYVQYPSFPELVQTLFPVQAPNNFPRTDLVAAYLTGLSGINKPANVVPAEMLRLNTSIAPTAAAAQNPLGVLGQDQAGFPNGRRPGDDVVDITLRVAMGLLCELNGTNDALEVGCQPSDAPSGGLDYTDGVRKSAANYFNAFPYLTTPIPGNFNPPPPAGATYP